MMTFECYHEVWFRARERGLQRVSAPGCAQYDKERMARNDRKEVICERNR